MKIGDVVCLAKGDGTLMKVEKFSRNRVKVVCTWFEDEELFTKWFFHKGLLIVIAAV